jgi:hypothetical protein
MRRSALPREGKRPDREQDEVPFGVRRLCHPDGTRMDGIETEQPECFRCGTRHILIEQEFHALFGKSITLSSSAVAA